VASGDGGPNTFIVRRFDPARDLDAAYRCYVSGFYVNSWPVIDHAEPRLVEDLILTTVAISDATFVAEVDGEARGVLSGYFPARASSMLRGLVQMARLQGGVLLRRYRMTPFARAAWWRMARGYLSFWVRQSRSAPAEVMMLNSQKEYRGGIGRALMDAWVAKVRSAGYDRTIVCTDSTISWDFYPRYGFERLKAFPLRSFFYALPGVDVEGYIYEYEISPEAGAAPQASV
jgi:GNAT superfamily N-acetyltransferase